MRVGRSAAAVTLLLLSGACAEDAASGGAGLEIGAEPPRVGTSSPGSGVTGAVAHEAELSLVAGVLGGHGHLDGVGTDTRFAQVSGVRLDQATRTLWVLENEWIRRVDLATKTVSTEAGRLGALPVPADEDGPRGIGRVQYLLGLSGGLARDPQGALYYARGHAIRRFSPGDGMLRTFAGSPPEMDWVNGPAADARFSVPSGFAASDDGATLYVGSLCSIRRVSAVDGTTTSGWPNAAFANNSFCGTADGDATTARFNAISSVERAGNVLYVLDGPRLRAVDLATGAVTTLSQAFGPGQVVPDVAGNRVFVVERATVKAFDLATSSVTVVAGTAGTLKGRDGIGPLGTFASAQGGAFDATESALYVGDRVGIRRVAVATGAVTTPYGAVNDEGAHVDGPAATARFHAPGGVAFDPAAQRIYVADFGGATLRAVSAATGAVTTVAGYPGVRQYTDGPKGESAFNTPTYVAWDAPRNRVIVADGTTLRAADATTGAIATLIGVTNTSASVDGPKIAARLGVPAGFALDPASSRLYFSDATTGSSGIKIRYLDLVANTLTTLAGTSAPGYVDGVGDAAAFAARTGAAFGGIAVDAGRGRLYVADTGNRVIRAVEIASGATTTLAGAAGRAGQEDGTFASMRFVAPARLAYDAVNDLLYVGDHATIRVLDMKLGTSRTMLGNPYRMGVRLGLTACASIAPAAELALGPDGELFLTSEGALLRAETR